MVSQRTGSNELVYIETDKVDFIIKGKATHPKFEGAEISEEKAILTVKCVDNCKIELYKTDLPTFTAPSTTYQLAPMFYEQQDYEIVIESKNNIEIGFWHENINVRNKITPVGRKKGFLSGIVNFGSGIGYSNFVIRVDGQDYLTVIVEVFPSKIEYREDYEALLEDVEKETYKLVFDFLKKTYKSCSLSDEQSVSLNEFYTIITTIFKDFLKATDLILYQPHHILDRTSEILPAHKAKRTNVRTMRWIEKHPENVRFENGKIVAAKSVLAIKKFVTYDTNENRFTKFILQSTVKKLRNFISVYQNATKTVDEAIISKLNSMIKELDRRCVNSFLSEVGQYKISSRSLVFSMALGYRELYKYYLMLLRGLSISEDIFNLSPKDMAKLYEYWCFIKLNSLLRNKYKLESSDVIKIKNDGLTISLITGDQATIKYVTQSGEEITLSYNPLVKNLPTVAQQPDNVLSLKKNGSQDKYDYVFDAKYRINTALDGTEYKTAYKTPGPEEDTINAMHRYRDAIVSLNNNYERTKFGAYILFPYTREEEYKEHHFYESIEKVNIGGLPFLPSATKLVEKLLDELIEESPESAFERTTLPVGIDEKLTKVDWEHRDVLIGVLKDQEQFDVCLKHKFYHIPKKRLASEKLPVHYVALYQSQKLFGKDAGILYYGEVVLAKEVKRNEITEIPKTSDELYYRFDIKEWKKLERKIEIQGNIMGRSPKTDTNLFLLTNGTNTTELQITSAEEYRLYSELKRYAVKDVEIDDDNTIRYKGNMIDFIDDKIIVNGEEFKSTTDFAKKPGVIFSELKKKLK